MHNFLYSLWEFFPHDHARSRSYRWGEDGIAGICDSSAELPTGGYLQQADGTSWMGMYCLNMLEIALELAKSNPTYEDIASKFFEHFLYIADAIDGIGQSDISLWDEDDGFYYDALCFPDGHYNLMKVRSLVGLIPLFGVSIIEPETLSQFPSFSKRTKWFIQNRPDLTQKIAYMQTPGVGERRLLAIAYPDKLRRILQKMLDENEFLSPYGIRSVSKFHQNHPYKMNVNGTEYQVDYQPAESTTQIFGGNSNWRGPIWFRINYLIIESLQRFYSYFGDDLAVLRYVMVDYPQINIKLLSEEDRELVKPAKQLRLTFKEFVLNCIKQALVEENPDSADGATAAEIEALKAQIAALSEKVSIPSASKTEVHTLQERLNQLWVGISNEIKKDRSSLLL